MNDRDIFINKLRELVADYQNTPITNQHIIRWVSQFDQHVQTAILREMAHVMQKTYFSKNVVLDTITYFNSRLLHNQDKRIHLLNIQKGGNSQAHMLDLAESEMQETHGMSIYDIAQGNENFIYLDDICFSGSRIIRDIDYWIQWQAPNSARLHIMLIKSHSGGEYYANKKIEQIIKQSGKTITVRWYKLTKGDDFENRLSYIHKSDILYPAIIPDDELVNSFVQNMRHEIPLRATGYSSTNQIFSGESGRHILEQEFIKAGVRIRKQSPYLVDTLRPLGYTKLDTLGFGSLAVTYRNCPNTTPLALWAGDPWYPLFPRTTNTPNA
jgi:hypothetical protein